MYGCESWIVKKAEPAACSFPGRELRFAANWQGSSFLWIPGASYTWGPEWEGRGKFSDAEDPVSVE